MTPALRAPCSGSHSAGPRRSRGGRVDARGVASRLPRTPQRGPTGEGGGGARWYRGERRGDWDELDFPRRIYGHDYTFNDGKQLGNERHAQELLNMWQWQRGKS